MFSRLYNERTTEHALREEVKPQAKISKNNESQLVNRLYSSRAESLKKREMAREIKEQLEADKYQKIRDSRHPQRSSECWKPEESTNRLTTKVSYRAERINKRLFNKNASDAGLKRSSIQLKRLKKDDSLSLLELLSCLLYTSPSPRDS